MALMCKATKEVVSIPLEMLVANNELYLRKKVAIFILKYYYVFIASQ